MGVGVMMIIIRVGFHLIRCDFIMVIIFCVCVYFFVCFSVVVIPHSTIFPFPISDVIYFNLPF
jgi:hypothetical protein